MNFMLGRMTAMFSRKIKWSLDRSGFFLYLLMLVWKLHIWHLHLFYLKSDSSNFCRDNSAGSERWKRATDRCRDFNRWQSYRTSDGSANKDVDQGRSVETGCWGFEHLFSDHSCFCRTDDTLFCVPWCTAKLGS